MSAPGILGLALAVILACPLLGKGQALDPKLAALEPLLNKEWTGRMKAPDGSAEWEVLLRYEAVWGGRVVKYARMAPAQNSSEEGFLYWDDIAKKIAIFAVHSSAVFSTGFVSAEKNGLTFEGRMTWPAAPPNPGVKQSYDFKNTFEFLSATELVDKWFQNAFGPWRPGHVISFQARGG
jgi:hypothetical protein